MVLYGEWTAVRNAPPSAWWNSLPLRQSLTLLCPQMPPMSLVLTTHRASGRHEAKGPLPLRPGESPECPTIPSLAFIAKGEGYSWGFIAKEMTAELWAIIPEVPKPSSLSDSFLVTYFPSLPSGQIHRLYFDLPGNIGYLTMYLGFPGGLDAKESACNAGDLDLMPGSGRFPREGNGNSLQHSCLEIPWMQEPGSYSPWSCRVGHSWATNTFTFTFFK